MATPLNNSPVKFAADINIAGCFPKGQRYFQLVQYGDDLMFQLPNICKDTAVNLATNGDFGSGDLTGWSQYDNGGESWVWSSGKGSVPLDVGLQTSKGLYQNFDFSTCSKIYVCFTVAGINPNGNGAEKLDLYTGDASGTPVAYPVSVTTDGTYCYCLDVDASVESIGFIAQGGIEEGDESTYNYTIDDFSVKCLECDIEICVLDADDNNIATIPASAVTYLCDVIQIAFNWSDTFYNNIPLGLMTSLPEGCYRLSICTGDYEGVLTSQWYNLRATHECTMLLSWTNTNDAYGFDYSAGLTHYLRVYARMRNPKYQGEKEIFADSAGNRYVLNATKIKKHELVISEQPEYIHDALSIGVDHDHFYIDGEEYFVEEPEYTPQWRGTSALSPVIIEVGESQQNLSNRLC